MADGRRLTTEELAVLIADSLVGARLLDRGRLADAVAVIATEIAARKGIGDY